MFKLDLASNEVDNLVDYSNLHVSCSFTPGTFTQVGEEDPYEAFMREIDVSFILDIYILERNKARCNGILTKR